MDNNSQNNAHDNHENMYNNYNSSYNNTSGSADTSASNAGNGLNSTDQSAPNTGNGLNSAGQSASNTANGLNSTGQPASEAGYAGNVVNSAQGTADSTQNAAYNSQQEGSSTYGYSYINQEQKNPYTVWRADENTVNPNTGTTYSNAQYGNSNTYGGAYQAQYDSHAGAGQNAQSGVNNEQSSNPYSSIYGDGAGGQQGGWNSYSDEKKQKKEERARKRAEKAANSNTNFGIKLAKCASIALIFGLVAGTAFEGASYVAGNAFGTRQEEIAALTEQDAGNKQQEAIPSDDQPKKTATPTAAAGVDVSATVEACMPSIVAITNLSQVQIQNFFGQVQNYELPSAGSGVIVGEDDNYLYIATNNHVVENNSTNNRVVETATTLTIQFFDETTASAEVKGTDRSSDLAVVKVSKNDIEKDTLSKIKIASLGDSDQVKVGSQAIAIGNALGYGQSVTGGWVSALNREVTIQDEKTGESFTNELIQTDAAINPGNSGGALLNSAGEVIGINSSKYSDTDVEGMGFAIPSNTAKPIIEDLIKREVVSDDKAAFLGLVGVDVTASISSAYHIPEGVCITELTRGGAAEKYGLQKGDIITKFDGKAVKTSQSLEKMLTYYEAGSEVEVTIQRAAEGGYQEQTVKIVLGKKNA